ncbi:MAG: hypothetical protein WBG10_18350 [Pseudolabrys sp.]
MKKLIGIAFVAATISTPAFAQNYGTGYSVNQNAAGTPARVHRAVPRQVVDPIYAMSPRGSFYGAYPYNDNTGGGSPGYNEMLLNW